MSAYEMLIKCGYSPEEAERISGQKRPFVSRAEIARANEEKYADALPSAEERIVSDYRHYKDTRYSAVGDRCVNQGECMTRKGVARRFKFGKGNMGRVGFMKDGFAENKGGDK